MRLGTSGSPLTAELNRLANNGEYPAMTAFLDAQGAANAWAGTTGLPTVGALNYIANPLRTKDKYKDIDGICNELAGTTGLDASDALATILHPAKVLLDTRLGNAPAYYVDAIDASASGQTITNLGNAGSLLPTTVGSSTAADSNDAKFLDFTGTNYVYLPGVASNNLSIPSSTALNITGDMDLRAYLSSDNWANGATFQEVISKWDTTANTRQYAFTVDTLGRLQLIYSTDGIVGVTTATSSVPVPFANGSLGWIRATRAQTAGEIKFFTGTDGTNWTQLGTTITGVTTSNFFTSTTPVMLGNNPTNSRMLIGKLYRAQIFSDITGTTKVLDVDTSVITTGAATSFTAVTGQTVTINRSTSGRKSVAVTQPTWLFGTDDYMEVNNRYMAKPAGTGNYLYLPGVASNFASTPDSAALDITGDIDLRCKVALDDWTPAATTALIDKRLFTTNVSYGLNITTAGRLEFAWSTLGTSATQLISTSSVSPTVTDGQTLWVRVTLDVDNGAGGNTTTFFTSDDGLTWTQLGTTVVKAAITSIYAGTSELRVGASLTGSASAQGKFFRAQVLNGIGGTLVFDANFENSITSLLQTSFTESSTNAATVTINRNSSTFRSAGVIDAGYLYPGATNTFANSTIDYLNFGATDSFTALAVVRQWVLGTTIQVILAKRNGTGSDSGYALNSGSSTNNFRTIIISNGTSNSDSEPGVVGTLSSIAGTITPSLITTYTNAVTGGSTARSVGTLSSVDTLGIGRYSPSGGGTGYADMELVAAAVFRTVLTATQISQLNNYFQTRY